jgi:hypothetical protein
MSAASCVRNDFGAGNVYSHMTRSRFLAPLLVAALLLLPGAYLGAYFALARYSPQLHMCDDGTCRRRHYRYGGEVAETAFWPLHWADRRMRPRYWDPE